MAIPVNIPVYATSRLITREYQPFLDSLGITYPQYLVLMVLWEAVKIPEELIKRLSDSELKIEDLVKLKENLNSIISFLSK